VVVGGIAADDFGIVGSVGADDAVFVGMGAVAAFLGGSVAAVAVAVCFVGIHSFQGTNHSPAAFADPVAAAAVAATPGFDVANAVAFVEVSQTLPRLRTRQVEDCPFSPR